MMRFADIVYQALLFPSLRKAHEKRLVCSLIIHEQILWFVSSATLIFMNYALNMKVYCVPASQIASPCFPISIDRPPKVPGALFSRQILPPPSVSWLLLDLLEGGTKQFWLIGPRRTTLLCLSAAIFS